MALSPDEEVELAALQRRAFGEGEEELSTPERGRLRLLLAKLHPHPFRESSFHTPVVPPSTTATQGAKADIAAPTPAAGAADASSPGDEHPHPQRPAVSDSSGDGAIHDAPAQATPPRRTWSAVRAILIPLIAVAVVFGVSAAIGGYLVGIRGSALTDPQRTAWNTAAAATAWDAGSAQIIAMKQGRLIVGGTTEGEKRFCVATVSIGFNLPATVLCDDTTPGSVIIDSYNTAGEGVSIETTVTATRNAIGSMRVDEQSTPTIFDNSTYVSMENGESILVPDARSVIPELPGDLATVMSAGTWRDNSILFVGALRNMKVWQGVNVDGDVCYIVTAAGAGTRCTPSGDGGDFDLTETASEAGGDVTGLTVFVELTAERAQLLVTSQTP